MVKALTRVSEKQLYPYLYGILFITYKSAQFFPSFSLFAALNAFILYCTITYILFFLIRKSGNRIYAGIPVIFFWASLLHFAEMAKLAGYRYAYIPAAFYIIFYTGCAVILIMGNFYLLKLSRQYAGTFNKIGNIFLLLLCLVVILNAIFFNKWENEIKAKTVHAKLHIQKERDIVWILMDEYGSSKILQEQFAFNNPLDSELRRYHFCILNGIQSRFNNTLFSLNAIFNLDDSTRPSSFYSGVRLLQQSRWVPLMESAGYHFVNLGLFDIGAHTKPSNRSGYPQNYLDQLFSGTVFNMISNKFAYTSAKCDTYNTLVFHQLMDTLTGKSSYPKLIWAHLGIPHEPFCRDANGRFLPDEEHSDTDSGFIKKRYTGYITYGNKLIEQLLAMPELAGKIVIISGDHGPRFPFLAANDAPSTSPFAAIHLPGPYDEAAIKKLHYISEIPRFILGFLNK